jgi:sarcosine oxidase subunit gamma
MSAPLPSIAGVTSATVAARFGLKGPQAPGWLAAQGIRVPGEPNHIARWSENGGGRCLRLGHGEFLVEQDHGASLPVATSEDVFVLLRSDASLVLDGPLWPRRLAQVCAFDFRRFDTAPDLVVMTLLAGISVTLVREPRPDDSTSIALRLWCDATHATYLQHCLRHLGETP